jgi:MFS family permease
VREYARSGNFKVGADDVKPPTTSLFSPRALAASFGAGLPANFWKLWSSSAMANLADGILLVAVPLIAIRLTDSPAELAGVAVAAQLPAVVLTLVAGGLADRLDRRWTMLAVQALRIAVLAAVTLLALADALSMPALYVAAFIIGAGEAFFDTNAQAILPSVVGRSRLVQANGRLFAVETVMNTFLGPPLGGFLIAISIPLALSGTTLGFVLAAIGLLLMSGRFRAERAGPARGLVSEIGEGIGFLWRHRLLLTLSGMVALGRLGSAGFFALFALYAVAPGPMGLSDPAFGLLITTLGAGSVVGSVVVGRLVRLIGRRNVLLLSTVVFAGGIGLPALTADVRVIAPGLFAAGMAVMSWNVTNVSMRQAILPSRLMGRVHATHRFLATVSGLVGAIVAGAVGELVGLPAVFAIGAGIVLIGLLGGLVVTEERIRSAEADLEPDG